MRERYLADAARSRSRVGELIALVFANPFVTVRRVEKALGITNQGARNLIRDAEVRGWLTKFAVHGRGSRQYWVAEEVFQIIEAPPLYQQRRAAEETDARADRTHHTASGLPEQSFADTAEVGVARADGSNSTRDTGDAT
ncbi:MAG: hypothetical protein LH630_10805 [Actinomycetia bacterium]|nr:hypothetical protein [Actinomycetes bacterium]